jgi:uncharacterized membrane protein YbhN (UPF0104 family)
MLAFKALLLSCVSQLVVFIGMYCLGVVLSVDKLSVTDYLFILPVGFVVNSIPLAPGGLGIGEAGFSALFLLFGSPEGAEFGLLFHIIFFILALGIGGLIYLFTDLSYKN